MAYHVIITGICPPMHAMQCATAQQAADARDYLNAMFPHLRGDCLEIVTELQEATPVSGFPRDAVQAYITTGNGYARPPLGAVSLGTGRHVPATRAMGV